MTEEKTRMEYNAPDQTAEETTEQFKKDFDKKVNKAASTALVAQGEKKFPNVDFDEDIDNFSSFITDSLKKLAKGSKYQAVLDFVIDFFGKVGDELVKTGVKFVQKFLAKKLHKDIEQDKELAQIIPEKDKQKIKELDNKLNPEEKGQEHSIKSPDNNKNVADRMRQNFQQPKHSAGAGDRPPMAARTMNQNKGTAR